MNLFVLYCIQKQSITHLGGSDMDINKAKERLDKVTADIEKRQAMIDKIEQKMAKLRDKVPADVWDSETDTLVKTGRGCLYDYRNEPFFDDLDKLYDLAYQKREMISKLRELEQKLEGAKTVYEKAQQEDAKFSDVPPILEELIEALRIKFLEADLEAKDKIIETLGKDRKAEQDYFEEQRRNGVDHPEWRGVPNSLYRKYSKELKKQMGKVRYDFLYHATEEDIEKACAKEAKDYVRNLWYRIKDIVGDVVDYGHLYLSGPAINGPIYGTKGNVRLETILAGGWNIQRLHYRVLIHKF